MNIFSTVICNLLMIVLKVWLTVTFHPYAFSIRYDGLVGGWAGHQSQLLNKAHKG